MTGVKFVQTLLNLLQLLWRIIESFLAVLLLLLLLAGEMRWWSSRVVVIICVQKVSFLQNTHFTTLIKMSKKVWRRKIFEEPLRSFKILRRMFRELFHEAFTSYRYFFKLNSFLILCSVGKFYRKFESIFDFLNVLGSWKTVDWFSVFEQGRNTELQKEFQPK